MANYALKRTPSVEDEPYTMGMVRADGRVRPTYTLAVPQERQKREYFARGQSRALPLGKTLVWREQRWRKVEGGCTNLKTRRVDAAVFDVNGLDCYFDVHQTHNASPRPMGLDAYVMCCDDQTQEDGEHAEAIAQVVREMLGREVLKAREVCTELSTLFVPRENTGRMSWREAMLTLLVELSPAEGTHMACVLKAAPLELVWRARTVEESKWWAVVTAHEEAQHENRKRALLRLYTRALGFKQLHGEWMGRVVRRVVPGTAGRATADRPPKRPLPNDGRQE